MKSKHLKKNMKKEKRKKNIKRKKYLISTLT